MKIESNSLKLKQMIFVLEQCSLEEDIKKYLIYKVKRSYHEEEFYFLNVYDELTSSLKEKLNPGEFDTLANEFGKKIAVYSKMNYSKPPINPRYYLIEYVPNFKTMIRESFVEKISGLDEDDIKILLQYEPIRKKLNLPELTDKELDEYAYAFHNNLSATSVRYAKHLGIDIKSFLHDDRCKYHNLQEENHIVRNYGIYVRSEKPKRLISVANIVGHDMCRELSNKNILYTVSEFYDYQKRDEYHNRAIGLLKYTSGEELIEEFASRNYETRDMHLVDIGSGKYEISSNGLHRFTVLRTLYLKDLLSEKYSDEELKVKYKIPVKVPYTLDYNRTYCNFLIKQVETNVSYIEFYNDEITVCFKDGSKKNITENELLHMAKKSALFIMAENPNLLASNYRKYSTFKKFIDENIPAIVNNMIEENDDEITLI